MLKANGLTFTYPGGQTMRFPEIDCQKGEHWLLIGTSGSGKTTLLQLLAGLRTPSSGEVHVADTLMTSLPVAARDKFRGQHIGIVFQQSYFVESLNVEENLMLAQGLAGKAINRKKIITLLQRLGISDKLKSRTRRLSQGEQQRVAIARALVNEPAVILADEPTSALDDQNTREVIALLEEQAQLAKATLLLVTHDGRLKDYFPKRITL